mgnify:CR=1 FL=1
MATPIRRQYLRIKKQYPDALVLFRLGDFYETFDDDAHIAARELEIVLTSRSMGKSVRVPMAGIPAHALESYLARLIKRGHKVAICEQLSDPAASKGLVERDVVRVVTPGTVMEPSLLDQTANNYLAAVITEGDQAGLAYVDITTSEFAVTQLPAGGIAHELDRLRPAELVIPEGHAHPKGWADAPITMRGPRAFELETAREKLLTHFNVLTLEAFGCDRLPLAVQAGGALLDYLEETQRGSLSQITTLRTYSTDSFMVLDPQTVRNLELFQGSSLRAKSPSLLSVLDLTRTPMGARLLRRWLGQPLLELEPLLRRQEAVCYFHKGGVRRRKAIETLSRISDMERLLNRVRIGTAVPRDLLALRASLEAVPSLLELLGNEENGVPWLGAGLDVCGDVVGLVGKAIREDPSGEVGEGGVIAEGFSAELDEARNASHNARDIIAGMEQAERERTGIRSLKVGYNKVFGYYIEVSKANLRQVPAEYMRRQTLVNGERFITPELKEHESLILSARERVEEMEKDLFRQVCRQVADRGDAIIRLAEAVAHVDVLVSLAEAAARYGYVRPRLTLDGVIEIKDGRHPVVERVVPPGTFVPNDTRLSINGDQLVVLTGPNMSGKSTYIRQVALIVLMAQIGSFVPAGEATIGLVDRIFTRVGLQDDLATGQSTFMVEMVETASILNQATKRSLVILDEIGRGTSTYDGLAIAQAVIEYLHNHPRLGCKVLFATHYHELTEMEKVLPRVRNYSVAVAEKEGDVVFLHRIVPGGADRSYGIHVAHLAGLPRAVTSRAMEVLAQLERHGNGAQPAVGGHRRKREQATQAPLFVLPSPLLEEVAALDVSAMTPIEAINKLFELQEKARAFGRESRGR